MLHVGITGPIASGKSTLATQLKEASYTWGFTAEIIPFAHGVKQLAATEYNTSRVDIMRSMLKQWNIISDKAYEAASKIDQYMHLYPSTPGAKNRKLLQYIGTEIGRDLLGENTWVFVTQQRMKEIPAADFIISDDMRFDNELFAVDTSIRIVVEKDNIPLFRLGCYDKRMKLFPPDYFFADHPSEQGLSYPTTFTIPMCFYRQEVFELLYKLNNVRMLRGREK